jgi:hypothetical protein
MMDTTMRENRPRRLSERLQHSRYPVPVFAVLMGGALLLIEGHAGDWRGGLESLGIMAAAAALFLFGGRSETIRGLRGDGRDERIAMIDLRATAFAGIAIIIAVIVGFMIELGRGHDGSPYTLLGFIGGVTYVGAILFQRFRS